LKSAGVVARAWRHGGRLWLDQTARAGGVPRPHRDHTSTRFGDPVRQGRHAWLSQIATETEASSLSSERTLPVGLQAFLTGPLETTRHPGEEVRNRRDEEDLYEARRVVPRWVYLDGVLQLNPAPRA
jgi:hypothetical protein